MPSSMIFVGLVVIWLLILVPAVARHRQEVARPSSAALAGRVLERPRRRQSLEVDVMDQAEFRTVATRPGDEDEFAPDDLSSDDSRAADPDADRVSDHDARDEWDGEHRWERPPPRYRRGRGGFDAEAAALTARARYAFRQRVVLLMLVAVVATGVVAAVGLPALWWVHGGVDIALVGYLVYLRRQVRFEESIRERRAARMAGTRRPSTADDPELDEWADRGRERDRQGRDEPEDAPGHEPERVIGAGVQHPAPLPAPVQETPAPHESPEVVVDGPALPRLQPAPPPTLPPGTALVRAEDEDPDLQDLGDSARPAYRRAVGE